MNRVDTLLASAGTGKTHALVRAMARAIEGGADPASLVATTFTVKAAGELVERVRTHLVAQGRVGEAADLLGARLGTVNSVCGRIVGEFAMELGLSPAIEVIPEESFAAVFATAADEAIAGAAPTLNALSESLGLGDRDVDWREQISRLVELARANGIGPERLAGCAERSVEGLLSLLPVLVDEDAEGLDEALSRELDAAVAAAGRTTLKATSAEAMAAVKGAQARLRRGDRLPWSVWAKLSKPKAAKADAAIFAAVAAAAEAHSRHPRLHRELRTFVEASFGCAAAALSAYRAHKAERGLVDFVDQETLALVVLRDPANRERLRETLGHVFVDEIQDCSPLQVAIFAEMARIAPRSTWVGDPKQCVYGFRSTDASLTLAATRGAASETGGSSEVLSMSWRSRPGICAFVNDAFVPAFESMGLSRVDSSFSGTACSDAGLDEPPLSVWHLAGKNKGQFAEAIAGGVAGALAEPASWPVREGGIIRGVRSGDVAVLCRGNDDVDAMATALSRCGVPVAVGRGSLLDAPEAQLVSSALRWVADRDDRLALVELARLVSSPAHEPSWLEALGSDDPDGALAALVPFSATLVGLRERQFATTPSEALDEVILVTGIVDLACRWGDPADRLQRFEALRGAAVAYERECVRLRSPATLTGLNAWLVARQPAMPRSSDPDAVRVMTYHKAKGLEWPVVVLCQLDKTPTASPFGAAVECDDEPDWREPMVGRWLRLWAWPYGRQAKDVHLDATAANSHAGRRAHALAREEAVRLLYVGVTRARDHLVLTTAEGRPPAWLGVLDGEDGPRVSLPAPGKDGMVVAGRIHPARSQVVTASVSAGTPRHADVHLSPLGQPGRLRPRRLRPSDATGVEGGCVLTTELGARLPLSGDPDMGALGEALHAFLACDGRQARGELRSATAATILERWGVAAHVHAADAVSASDRLWHFLNSRFPDARVRREVPVQAAFGRREVMGRIDVLVEMDRHFAVIDHKSFPGRRDLSAFVARSHAPQLALYADAVSTVTGLECRGLFVHMPLIGLVVEVTAIAAAS